MKETQRMSTCNQLDLQTVESNRLLCPKISLIIDKEANSNRERERHKNII